MRRDRPVPSRDVLRWGDVLYFSLKPPLPPAAVAPFTRSPPGSLRDADSCGIRRTAASLDRLAGLANCLARTFAIQRIASTISARREIPSSSQNVLAGSAQLLLFRNFLLQRCLQRARRRDKRVHFKRFDASCSAILGSLVHDSWDGGS